MGKTFGEYLADKRRAITFPDGTEVVLRRPSYALLTQFGPVPGVEDVGSPQRQVEIARRLVTACVLKIGEEVDPIGRGLMTFEDFTKDEVDAIVEGATKFMSKGVADDSGVPLADTDSPPGRLHSLTVSDNVSTSDPQVS
jgi:hypothetical protein